MNTSASTAGWPHDSSQGYPGPEDGDDPGMEKRFTPGPWRVADTSIVTEEVCVAVIEDDGEYAAPLEERAANARLISSAPDLQAAVEAALWILTEGKEGGPPVSEYAAQELLRGALAKARGEGE